MRLLGEQAYLECGDQRDGRRLPLGVLWRMVRIRYDLLNQLPDEKGKRGFRSNG